MIQALGLRELFVDRLLRSKLEHKPTRTFFSDSPPSIILKRGNSQHARGQLLSREVCILQLLQRFVWAPRLLCAGADFLLTTYMGRPACTSEMNSDLTRQLETVLNNMGSVGVRHNDLMRRSYRGVDSGSIEVMLRDQRISLVDFALGSVNGTHAISCTFDGKLYTAPADTKVHNAIVHTAQRMPERTAEVIHEMQNCSGLATTP